MSYQRVYIASTPYHLLIALALQDRDGCPDAIVLFADEAGILTHAPGIEEAVGSLVALQSAPTYWRWPRWELPVRSRLVARSAQRFAEAAGTPAEVYISNGYRPESQRLYRAFAGRTSFNFFEDGLDAYIDYNYADVGLWRRSLFRVLCGIPHPQINDNVGVFPYERYHVIAPELCRAPGSFVEGIPTNSLRHATEILAPVLHLPIPEQPITDLYLLANSERMSDPERYLQTMRASFEQRVADDATTFIAVKGHPREKNNRFMEEARRLGDYEVPHWIPAELLTQLLSPRVSIHSGLTTFIVSSHRLLPERRVYLDHTVSPEHVELLRRWDPNIAFAEAGPRQAADCTIDRQE